MKLKIQYQCTKIEDLSDAKFDLIIASEIIEHIENRKSFLDNITKISNSKSSIVITTINKSLPNFLMKKITNKYFKSKGIIQNLYFAYKIAKNLKIDDSFIIITSEAFGEFLRN